MGLPLSNTELVFFCPREQANRDLLSKSLAHVDCKFYSKDLQNGTAFLFQFVNAHLLPNLSQNRKPTYSPCRPTMTKNVA